MNPVSRAEPTGIVALALVAVYFIWGSTYLALRFGLEGFPPFLLNGIRFLIAGIALFAFLRLRGAPTPTRRQVWNATRMGVLLLVGGVGGMTLALQNGIGSGLAATAAAVIPVWAALFAGLFGQWPVRREWIGLTAGFVGVVILAQEGDFQTTGVGLFFAIAAPLSWSFGSVWGSKRELPKGLMAPAVELLAAGVVAILIGMVRGDRIEAAPPGVSIVALAYLAVFGSIIAYTAYVFLLKTVRPALATSYAYANPVVAIILGLTLGQEVIDGPAYVALPLILIGVALVAGGTRDRRASGEPEPGIGEAMTEAA